LLFRRVFQKISYFRRAHVLIKPRQYFVARLRGFGTSWPISKAAFA
jgi:hypothetical protein